MEMTTDSLLKEFNMPLTQIPEGIRRLKEDALIKKVFIYGTETVEKCFVEYIEKYSIHLEGIIAMEGEEHREKFLHLYPIYRNFDSICDYEKISVIVGFCWNKYQNCLKRLLINNRVEKIYILEGAQYKYIFEFCPEKKLLIHEKLCLLDSSFPTTLKRNITYDFLFKNAKKFVQTYNWLEDEFSRNTMMYLLKGHIYLLDFPMKSVRIGAQYFVDGIINLHENETFVDCGAFIGDSIEPFFKKCNGKYRKIYGLEPDNKIFKELKDKMSRYKNCFLLNVGAFSENKKVGFFEEKGASFINEGMEISNKVEVRRLDDILKDEKITFLKMDIEGAELEALKGAMSIIEKQKPKLAICVYHKPEDLISIPQFIKGLVPEYKLYLRAHFENLSEIVLYAVL